MHIRDFYTGFRVIAVLLICIPLFSCTKKNEARKPKARAQVKRKTVRAEYAYSQEQEAKLLDIPLPLAIEPLKAYAAASEHAVDTVMLGYASTDDTETLMQFYTVEMERLGWQQSGSFDGYEQLLCFTKPSRQCVVSLRPHKGGRHKTQLVLFVGT